MQIKVNGCSYVVSVSQVLVLVMKTKHCNLLRVVCTFCITVQIKIALLATVVLQCFFHINEWRGLLSILQSTVHFMLIFSS